MTHRNVKDTWIYHERQDAALCGQHALNNLLQINAFSPDSLADVAHDLDRMELAYMADNNEGGLYSKEYLERVAEGSHNVDDDGNFSIQVLRAALKNAYGLELRNIREQGVLDQTQVTDMEGFICNKSSHWFAIRSVNGRYWNLNSTASQPQVITHFRLAAEIESLQNEGYSVFCVIKGLPLPNRQEAEERRGFVSEFWWREADLLSGTTNTALNKDPWENVGAGNRLDGKPTTTTTTAANDNGMNALEDMSEEEMMQMALAASLQQEQHKPNESSETIMAVPEEPPQDAKGVVKIQFRLPNGDRVIRRFLPTDSVALVYAFVRLSSNEHHKNLELRCGFPPKDLKNSKEESIETAKLSGEMVSCRFV